jgi:thiazole/oxazole-forming peptide maturase SagD family component
VRVCITGNETTLAAPTRLLLKRMLCPLTGLSQEIGFVMRGPGDPRIAIAGGEMTGVHVLRGAPPPPRGAYHIGGSGMTYDEAVIRTLGETVERYAQFTAFAGRRLEAVPASLDELLASGCEVLAAPDLRLFSDEQLSRPGFPFAPIDADTTIGWLRGRSPRDGAEVWMPAQQAAVGYPGLPGEPRFAEGVTTGSAAHTDVGRALRNALLELVQIDAAMGHWYGHGRSVVIGSDERTRPVERAVARRLVSHGLRPSFRWLRSADLPGFAIACLVERPSRPTVAIGLGCDLRLVRAMYNAFLEAVAVFQLAKVSMFRREMDRRLDTNGHDGAARIYDLDSNVVRYAESEPGLLRARFAGEAAAPSDLPPDVDLGVGGDLAHLLDAFAETGKRMGCMDMTTDDVRALGFRVVRVWSPDMLTLSLPDAPPVLHPRFAAYGGFGREDPHPYP